MTFDCLYEERAGILQYQAFFSRAEAEDRAFKICYRRIEMKTGRDGGVEFKHTLVAPGGKKPGEKQVAKPEAQTEMSFDEFRAQARNRFNYE